MTLVLLAVLCTAAFGESSASEASDATLEPRSTDLPVSRATAGYATADPLKITEEDKANAFDITDLLVGPLNSENYEEAEISAEEKADGKIYALKSKNSKYPDIGVYEYNADGRTAESFAVKEAALHEAVATKSSELLAFGNTVYSYSKMEYGDDSANMVSSYFAAVGDKIYKIRFVFPCDRIQLGTAPLYLWYPRGYRYTVALEKNANGFVGSYQYPTDYRLAAAITIFEYDQGDHTLYSLLSDYYNKRNAKLGIISTIGNLPSVLVMMPQEYIGGELYDRYALCTIYGGKIIEVNFLEKVNVNTYSVLKLIRTIHGGQMHETPVDAAIKAATEAAFKDASNTGDAGASGTAKHSGAPVKVAKHAAKASVKDSGSNS